MSSSVVYNDKLLSENFQAISDSFNWVVQGFQAMDARFAHLEGHIAELSKQPKVVVRNKRVLPFVAGVAIGIYLYKKSQKGSKSFGNVEFVFDNQKKDDATTSEASQPTTVEGDVILPADTDI